MRDDLIAAMNFTLSTKLGTTRVWDVYRGYRDKSIFGELLIG